MAAIPGKRQAKYSDQDKAQALTILAANGGNVKSTALQLGIPRKTLSDWASGQAIKPAIIAIAEAHKQTLADKWDELADLGITLAVNKLKTEGKNFEAERALDIAERAVKTARLLKGEPTSISEQGTPTQYKEKLDALRAMRAKRDERRLSKVS